MLEGTGGKASKLWNRCSGNDRRKKEFVIALRDYDSPKSKSGIKLKKGDQLLLLSDTDPDLCDLFSNSEYEFARIAPKTFRFFMWISSEEAAEQLTDPKFACGCETQPTLIHLRCNIPVLRDKCAFRIKDGTQSFETIGELVKYHAERHNNTNILLTFSVKKHQLISRWEYHKPEVVKEESIGEGCFGEVFKGKLNGQEVVALKKLKIWCADEFMKEVGIARWWKHPNVLETIGICSAGQYIITEFLANESLKEYMRNNELLLEYCKSVAQKIASGMEYLASKKIVHRDLAARNILVGDTLDTIKIADFGLAGRHIDLYYITHNEIFPVSWTAPEAFVFFQGMVPTKEDKITSAADVWSYGVVLWELYSNGEDPYRDIERSDLYRQLKEVGYRLKSPTGCPDEVYSIMKKCWKINRKERPTFSEIRTLLSRTENEPSDPSHDDAVDQIVSK